MWLIITFCIYFFVRGVFELFGQGIFYRRNVLEQLDPEVLPSYLKEVGICHILTGTVFFGNILLTRLGSSYASTFLWIGVIICTILLAKCNSKYTKS